MTKKSAKTLPNSNTKLHERAIRMKSEEIKSRIEISKRNGDYYRQLSFERTSNPPLNQPTTLPDNKHKTKQEFIDDLILK